MLSKGDERKLICVWVSILQVLGNNPQVMLAVPIRWEKGDERKIIGVLCACDKTGMMQFDQVDEINAMALASAAAIGLRHTLAGLKKSYECRQSQVFVNAILSLLKVPDR